MYVCNVCIHTYIPRVASSLFLASDAGRAPTWERYQLDAVLGFATMPHPCVHPVPFSSPLQPRD